MRKKLSFISIPALLTALLFAQFLLPANSIAGSADAHYTFYFPGHPNGWNSFKAVHKDACRNDGGKLSWYYSTSYRSNPRSLISHLCKNLKKPEFIIQTTNSLNLPQDNCIKFVDNCVSGGAWERITINERDSSPCK